MGMDNEARQHQTDELAKAPAQPDPRLEEPCAAEPVTVGEDDQDDADGGIGWFASFALVMLVLAMARFLIQQVVDPAYAHYVLIALALFFFLSGTFRRALVITTTVVMCVSMIQVGVQDGGAPWSTDRPWSGFVKRSLHQASGWGPGKAAADISPWKVRRLQAGIRAARTERNTIPPDLRLWTDPITTRDPNIEEHAMRLVEKCPDNDDLCVVATLNRFVVDKITYRLDPRVGGKHLKDHVRPASRTLELAAGDCEDQSILLASLLEWVGQKTLLAFAPGHVYPMVCFERSLEDLRAQALASPSHDSGYHGLLFDPAGVPHQGQAIKGWMLGDDTKSYCYDLEPTQAGAWIGKAHQDPVRTIVDPIRDRVVWPTAPRAQASAAHGVGTFRDPNP